jgi:hypothetical protein
MFVHDFVMVERPVRVVVAELEGISDATLGALVVAAWTADRDRWLALGWTVPARHELAGPTVHLGQLVEREDATLLPLSWVSEPALGHCPDLQGDVEVTRNGDGDGAGAYIHLLATYVVKDIDDTWTDRTAPIHRMQLHAVRRFLTMLGELLESGCSLGLTTPSAPRR